MGSESKNNGGVLQIPAASKKVVQSIKEIVNKNCTDAEIYSVLCDCSMDADAAIQILLTQDTFHQVKSKRERRKEMKETQESKARGNINGYRGVKVSGEYNVGHVPSQISYNDLGKAAYRKENGVVAPSGPSTTTLIYRVKTTNEQPSAKNSDSCDADDRRQGTGAGDAISSSAQPSSGNQAAWSAGTAGHVSMADIVRMGRPQKKGSQIVTETPSTPQDVVHSVNSSQHCCKPSCDSSPCPPERQQGLRCPHTSWVPETICESGVTASFHDEWPLFEQQTAAGGSYTFNVSNASSTEMFSDQSYFHGKGTNFTEDCHSEEVRVSERDAANKNPGTGSGFHLPFPNDAAPLNDEVSSVSVDLQQLSLGMEEPVVSPSEDKHAVLFPEYMQALAADCSHLSFGTYKSGAYNGVSGALASTPVKTDLEDASAGANGSSAPCNEIRKSEHLVEYPQDEPLLGSMSGTHRLTGGVGIHNMPVYSQPGLMRQSIHEVAHGCEYTHPLSVPDYNFEETEELSFPLGVRVHPKARNLSSVHTELQASSSAISLDVLASSIQSSRDSDYAKSSFAGTQSVPSRFGITVSSTGNPSIPQSEVLSPSAFSLPVSYSPALPGASLAPQAQHLSSDLYSQPPVSLEELTNLTGYPAIPQSYSRNPSAFQQAYQDSSMFHDSLSSMGYGHLQYNTGVSRSNLPLYDADISGYGGFGSAANFPGAILQAATPTGSAGGYDSFHSQYQERNNFTTLHQNDGSSRMMSALPDNGYFSLPGHNQLLSGYPQSQQQLSQDYRPLLHPTNYQQGQRLSQDYGAIFHSDAYHSQAGIPPEQQHQSHSDLSFSSSPAPKPLQQLWQQSY